MAELWVVHGLLHLPSFDHLLPQTAAQAVHTDLLTVNVLNLRPIPLAISRESSGRALSEDVLTSAGGEGPPEK